MHQHPGKQWAGRRDGRRREADGRAQRQRGLHQGRAAALRLRRRRRRGTGRTPGAACAELRKDGISMWLKIAEIALLAALAADLLLLLILCAKEKAAEKEIKEIRKRAAEVAEQALWKHFIQYYYEAYDIALCNAMKRQLS